MINIDTIMIGTCFPEYIYKDVKKTTGLIRKKTTTIQEKDSLNLSVMKDYPTHIIDKFEYMFKDWSEDLVPVTSIEYTLTSFCRKHSPCKIISVIQEDEHHLCIVWENEN